MKYWTVSHPAIALTMNLSVNVAPMWQSMHLTSPFRMGPGERHQTRGISHKVLQDVLMQMAGDAEAIIFFEIIGDLHGGHKADEAKGEQTTVHFNQRTPHPPLSCPLISSPRPPGEGRGEGINADSPVALCPPLSGGGHDHLLHGHRHRVREQEPSRGSRAPPGGSSILPDFISSGSSVP